MIKLNLNSLLVILGGLGVFALDVTAIATWLEHTNIHWVSYVAKGLGFVAVFFASAPLAVPKLRAFLALFKLATPAGTVVPSSTQPASSKSVVPVGQLPPAPLQSDGGVFKRFTVTLKRSNGALERQEGISVFRMNWSEREVLTRLRADGYPIGASATLSGWPASRFGVRSMQGLLILEDMDLQEASNWGGQPADTNSQLTSLPTKKEGGFIHPVASVVGLVLSFVLLLLMIFLYGRMAKAEETAPVATPAAADSATPTPGPSALPSASSVSDPLTAPVPAPAPVPALSPASPPPTVVTPAVAPTEQATRPEDSRVIDPKYPEEAAIPVKAAHKSKYGGCEGNFCLAPALALQVFQYVPSTGNMTGGVAFNGGYGLIWHTIIDLGVAFYAGVQFSRDRPFEAQGLMMINVANYVAFGPGFQMLGQTTGPAKFLLTICFAANWIPGITPS